MCKRFFFAVVACFAVLCFCGQRAYGQAVGSFQGTVTDKSGSAISGAKVTVASQTTGATRDTITDQTGHYVVNLLPVSVYTVRVEFQGFQTAESKDLKLQVDEQRELDFTLSPATVSSTVEVSADAVAVETANPTLGQVITSQQVTQLPLNGRDFVQLATLTPGTTQETNPNSFFTSGASSEVAARGSFSLSVGGSRPNSTDWLLDGADDNELTAGGIAIYSSIDSIQEFKVLTYNYSAEYGTRAGPTVLLTTKSGSNDFHGSLFEFFRNTDLDAKSFFATSTEKFNLNQFGGSIGGPIRKNKTFFFLDGEQKYQRYGITYLGLVPTEAMRSGNFSADPFGNTVPLPNPNCVPTSTNSCVPAGAIVNPNMAGASTNPSVFPNAYYQCVPGTSTPTAVNANGSQAQGSPCYVIPQALLNPIAQKMVSFFPMPNLTGNSTSNFINEPVRSLNETKFDVRIDQNFSSSDNMFARFSYDQAVSYVPGGAPGFAEANAFASNQGIANHARSIAIGETHVISPTTVNQFTFGYSRIFDYITSTGTGTCESTIVGIPGANTSCGGSNGTTCQGYSCGLTSTQFDGGYWALGDRGYAPFQGGTNIFSINDSFDMIRGKHDIKIGGNIRANQMNVGTEGFQDGYWVISGGFTSGGFANAGNPVADFMQGLSTLAIHDQTFPTDSQYPGGPVTGRRWKIYRPFVQDDWRVTKDLTLNLGVAWDLTTPISEEHWRQADLVDSTGQLLIPGEPGIGPDAGIQMNWTAFEPRIGGAWKVMGSDKTVFRAGYGMFHDSAWSMGAQGLWQNPPFFAESDVFGGSSPYCAFSTSYCATVLGQSASGVNISNGFQVFNTRPNPATFSGALLSQPTNFKLGMVQQYNANIQHELPGQVLLTVGYAGSKGRHILVYGNDLNTDSPSNCVAGGSYTLGCLPNGAPFAPFPLTYPYFFNTIYCVCDSGQTQYNSLQIKAETKSSRHGIYALIGYTYSRTYDNGLSDGLGSVLSAPYFPLPNWSKLDWGLSQINLNNSFTASVIYDLPFGKGKKFGSDWNGVTNSLLGGWQVTLIEKITSGFPVPLIDSNNLSGTYFQNGNGDNYNRPNYVPGCNVGAANHSVVQWINASCFTFPAMGELGNANRVPATGPDFVNTDFSLIKQFALPWENMSLNFRAEFFNLFNHAQFGMPVNDINAPGFGAVESTVNNPRLVQFALKLTF
jgi:carboxypeptidase family protein